MSDAPKKASIKDVADAVKIPGETLKDFSATWKELPEEDKEQLRQGVGDGSMTY